MRARRTPAAKALWEVFLRSGRVGGPGLGARLGALPRMVAAALRGRYPHLSKGRLVLLGLGLLYVLSPFDLVPEAVLSVFGLGDDALVVAWLAGSLLGATEEFLDWEDERRRTVAGQIVR